MREEEEGYHAEDIVYPLRRLAANEPGLDDTLVRQSSMYGERQGRKLCIICKVRFAEPDIILHQSSLHGVTKSLVTCTARSQTASHAMCLGLTAPQRAAAGDPVWRKSACPVAGTELHALASMTNTVACASMM